MYCTDCGTRASGTAQYCHNCGASLASNAVVQKRTVLGHTGQKRLHNTTIPMSNVGASREKKSVWDKIEWLRRIVFTAVLVPTALIVAYILFVQIRDVTTNYAAGYTPYSSQDARVTASLPGIGWQWSVKTDQDWTWEHEVSHDGSLLLIVGHAYVDPQQISDTSAIESFTQSIASYYTTDPNTQISAVILAGHTAGVFEGQLTWNKELYTGNFYVVPSRGVGLVYVIMAGGWGNRTDNLTSQIKAIVASIGVQ
jgi:hypothetical protein